MMKTVKVSELEGEPLDWAVGVSLGHTVQHSNNVGGLSISEPYSKHDRCVWSPSTDWSQGGPLIDAYGVKVGPVYWPFDSAGHQWFAVTSNDSKSVSERGDTALIAACRAIVAAKLGGEIEVPEELL